MKKFTFRTEKPIGKWKSFGDDINYIKIGKIDIGQILEHKRDDSKIKIMFAINKKDIMEDGNPNCKWRNAILKKEFNSVDEAKEWLNSEGNFERLNSQFNFAFDRK